MITTFFKSATVVLWMYTRNVSPNTKLATAVLYEDGCKIVYSPIEFGGV